MEQVFFIVLLDRDTSIMGGYDKVEVASCLKTIMRNLGERWKQECIFGGSWGGGCEKTCQKSVPPTSEMHLFCVSEHQEPFWMQFRLHSKNVDAPMPIIFCTQKKCHIVNAFILITFLCLLLTSSRQINGGIKIVMKEPGFRIRMFVPGPDPHEFEDRDPPKKCRSGSGLKKKGMDK